MAKEIKCICADPNEWVTYGAVDVSISRGVLTEPCLIVTGRDELGYPLSNYIRISYCPMCGRDITGGECW